MAVYTPVSPVHERDASEMVTVQLILVPSGAEWLEKVWHPELMQVKLHVCNHVTHGLSLRKKSFKCEF